MKAIFVASLALVLMSCCIASAQFYDTGWPTGEVERKWNFHAGAAFLSGDTDDDVEPIIGFEVMTPTDTIIGGARGALTFSIDYLPISQPGGTASLFPILVNYKAGDVTGHGYSVFGGLGLGVYLARDDIPGMELEDGFNFAWNVVGGINLSPEWFLQVRWLAGSNPSDDGILATEIGFRF